MKIAVISDSHDHVWNIRRFVEQANGMGVERVIHCGDLVSAFMLEEMEGLRAPLHLVWGNNPGDRGMVTRACLESGGRLVHHGTLGELELGGLRLAWIHDPHLAWSLAQTGRYNLVCYGHTHRWREEWIERTLLLNPGEILGKKEAPGWALVETDPLRVEQILLHQDGTGGAL